jgi:hypothetical protein
VNSDETSLLDAFQQNLISKISESQPKAISELT